MLVLRDTQTRNSSNNKNNNNNNNIMKIVDMPHNLITVKVYTQEG